MRRALSVIELIFVMIVIGILATIAINSFKTHNLQNDANFIYLKMMEAKYQGLAYDKSGLTKPDGIGCIDLGEQSLKKMAQKEHYQIKSALQNSIDTLCFDSFGRPHKDDNLTQESSLITQAQKILQLTYKNQKASFMLYPKSGYLYVIISHTN
ncbi:type II secretion system protein [Nitratiruptor sp. YY09-18]|uniref:type II secretion system protein n=1 Tax=Nitratiruptor sp. YY09-18 TaxID=2724901 RepID=UPI00191582BB|nr:type II secretion system protein [Nitratiruptor sp. YY09-18]BCD68676.1 hypothetical protein NitYY0918_C1593 [Nitratiruptor sp. YY09-18]